MQLFATVLLLSLEGQCCIYITKKVCKKCCLEIKRCSVEVCWSDSPCFTLCRICLVDLSSSAPSIRAEWVQFISFVHMPRLHYKALIVHSASLSGMCCTVLVPRNKTPTSISSQLAFRETKKLLWALVTVAPKRRRITWNFIGGELTMGGKPLPGQTSEFVLRFPRKNKQR